MNYKELITKMELNHFYPNLTTNLETLEIENLWLDVRSPFTADDEVKKIKEVVEQYGFKVDYLPNHQQIHITQIK